MSSSSVVQIIRHWCSEPSASVVSVCHFQCRQRQIRPHFSVGVSDGFPDPFNPVFDGGLGYVLLSTEGALDRSLGCTETEPQESAMSYGRALKERRGRLWKGNPARLICRPFRAGSIFYAFPGVPLRSMRQSPDFYQARLPRLRAHILGHRQEPG